MGKKRGRPEKAPQDILAERIEIRVSVADRKAFEAAAASKGLKLSEWIRRKLLAACPNPSQSRKARTGKD
jgi:uncharacterized protein (DUF1778 family)